MKKYEKSRRKRKTIFWLFFLKRSCALVVSQTFDAITSTFWKKTNFEIITSW